ncbi:MAG: NTP transferase domain-containing protein [Candidatus Bathyarchaeales archaeon]
MKIPALIMAGGKGKRFHLKIEKPLAPFLGNPLINWVVDAVKSANKISDFYIVTSPNTLETEKKCLKEGLKVIRTDGKDYHPDLKQAIIKSQLNCPVLTLSSDLPALTGTFLDQIISVYEKCGKPALTVLVPMEKCMEIGISTASTYTYKGAVYAVSGINIIDGSKISEEELDQEVIISDSVEAALNINSLEDLRNAEKYLKNIKKIDARQFLFY